MRRGVVVLNDPEGLRKAMNKMYFQHFPEEVRPQTLISRNRDDIKAFIAEVGGVCSGAGRGFLIQLGVGLGFIVLEVAGGL